jgi:hypothetical protein
VGHVVKGVAEYATTVSSGCRIPVPEDDGVGKLPERRSEDDEKCRRHDQSVFIHRKVVVDAVKEEMQRNTNTVIWKVSVLVSSDQCGQGGAHTHPGGIDNGAARIR